MHAPFLRLFERHFATEPTSIYEIGADGSNRSYFRLVGPAMETAIGAVGPDPDENRAFVSFTRSFRAAGFPVPDLYGFDEAAGVWLQEDLGDTTLFDALVQARQREEGRVSRLDGGACTGRVLERTAPVPGGGGERDRLLGRLPPRRPSTSSRSGGTSTTSSTISSSWRTFRSTRQRLEADFETLSASCSGAELDYFLYRDFQSRNIMLRDGEPWFIDYQGGRRGALQYDVASLLYDAKAAMPDRGPRGPAGPLHGRPGPAPWRWTETRF